VQNRDALDHVLSSLVSEKTVDECSAMMDENAIPGGPIREVADALAHPQAAARNMIVELAHQVAGPIKVTGFPIGLSETPSGPEIAPPALGADTEDVLRNELDLSPSAIAALKDSKVVA
jgi:crotonobetainyl-CoA:carnitine CoA-transferase CaiB-like acyl-CoA transferase